MRNKSHAEIESQGFLGECKGDSGIPERIGYARDGRGFLLTKSIPVPKPHTISINPDARLAYVTTQEPGHFGLRQMVERIEGLGGRLEFDGALPSGFRVRGILPLR